jgi:hypothetical protein
MEVYCQLHVPSASTSGKYFLVTRHTEGCVGHIAACLAGIATRPWAERQRNKDSRQGQEMFAFSIAADLSRLLDMSFPNSHSSFRSIIQIHVKAM